MKTIAIIISAIMISIGSFAQSNSLAMQKKTDFYLGIQSGLESFTGVIGVTADFRAFNNFYLRAGAGIGSWGAKLSFGIRNEKSDERGIGYGVYVSRATGLKDFSTEMETTTGTRDVKLDLLAGMTLNPVLTYKWVTQKGHRFFLEGGYAVPLQTEPWKIKDGSVLTSTSKQAMKILSPGGLSLGLGIQFAL